LLWLGISVLYWIRQRMDNLVSFSPYNVMLAIAFVMLRNVHFIPSFFRVFIMKWCWILLKAFIAPIEMFV
jgi:hypothetical protein